MLVLQFFLREQGIIYETSTPHIYQKNSYTEQLNCTLLEKIQLIATWSMSIRFLVKVCNYSYSLYIITHLLGISNVKHLIRSSWVINLKYCTSMSLGVKHISFFPVKFILINLHYSLNWWYSLGMRTMVITLCAIHKKISFLSELKTMDFVYFHFISYF